MDDAYIVCKDGIGEMSNYGIIMFKDNVQCSYSNTYTVKNYGNGYILEDFAFNGSTDPPLNIAYYWAFDEDTSTFYYKETNIGGTVNISGNETSDDNYVSTYYNKNPDIVSVSSDGTVKGLKKGRAEIIRYCKTVYADQKVATLYTVDVCTLPTYIAPTAKTLTYNGSAQSLVNAGTVWGGTMQYCVGSTTGTWTTNPTATNVNYLVSMGIITGYEDGTFRPYDNITRQEFATMISSLGEVMEAGDMPFGDVSEANWGIDYIYTVYTNGWVSGYEDGTFRPENQITRAEAVKIVNGYLGRGTDEAGIAGTEYTSFPDVETSHWAYYDIIEAANEHTFTKNTMPEKWVD